VLDFANTNDKKAGLN